MANLQGAEIQDLPDASGEDINPQRSSLEYNKTPEEMNALLNQKETELQQVKWENRELKKKLSEIKSRLRFLEEERSDSNDQPSLTEVSTRFLQIYEYEWTDAFENIPNKTEEERIRALYTIVMRAFAFCEKKMNELKRRIGKELNREHGGRKIAPEQLTTQLNDELRRQYPGETARVEEEFITTILVYMYDVGITSEEAKQSLQKYASKCAKICWLLLACYSNVSLSSAEVDTQFDRNLFRPYTKGLSESGQSAVEFCVWPALLGTDGHVLAQGFAQPKTLEQRNP